MAKVKIEAQNISGSSGQVGYYDLTGIPPLGDPKYVSEYKGSEFWADMWWSGIGGNAPANIEVTYLRSDGSNYYAAGYNYPLEPQRAWRGATVTNTIKLATEEVQELDNKQIRLTVVSRRQGDYTVYSNNGPPYIEIDYVAIPITVSSPSLSGTHSKDKPIALSWIHGGSPQYEYEIKYVYNGIETIKKVQSNLQSHTFAPGELPEGKITYQLRLSNGFIKTEWTAEKTFTTYSHKVVSLEPNGVAQNKDNKITVTWSGSEPYTKFEFEYSCNKETKMITGTTATSYVFLANFFDVETVSMRIRIYNGYVWSEWKLASFITYGKPEKPTITSSTVFDTAYPTFEWEVAGQTGYNLQVLEGEVVIYDTGDVISGVRSHVMSKALDNNKTYTLRLSVKNQYGYNSDYAFQNFSVAYAELQKPVFTIFQDYINGAHIIDIVNIDDGIFKECEVHRKEKGKDWIRIAKGLARVVQFRDITIRSNTTYYYRVRAVSTAEGISDSDTKLSYTLLKHAQLLDLSTNDITMLKTNFKHKANLKQDMSEKFYAGRRTPVINYGEKKYKVINISFAVKTWNEAEQFEDLYYSGPTLLFRDPKGEKRYCYISVEPVITPSKNYWTIELAITELSYDEGV